MSDPGYYRIFVEEKTETNKESNSIYGRGDYFSLTQPKTPWRDEQRQAVRRAVALHINLDPKLDEAEKEARINSEFYDVTQFAFEINCKYVSGGDKLAFRLYKLLRGECEPHNMIVTLIYDDH